MTAQGAYKRCSTCKQPIGFENTYYRCSVSTCNGKRTGLFFCSVECWQAHVPEARHRDAWAEEERAPTRVEWEREREQPSESTVGGVVAPKRRLVATQSGARMAGTSTNASVSTESDTSPETTRDVLVVTSKLKAFIKGRSGMSTSDRVVEVLSDHLRELAVRALRHAASDGRRTVLDRDFSAVLRDLGL